MRIYRSKTYVSQEEQVFVFREIGGQSMHTSIGHTQEVTLVCHPYARSCDVHPSDSGILFEAGGGNEASDSVIAVTNQKSCCSSETNFGLVEPPPDALPV